MSQYLFEKLEVDLESEVFDVAQYNGQGENEGADVGQSLGLQVPDDIELFSREPAAPQHETHDDDGQHTVENAQDAVLFEEQQALYVRPEIKDERQEDLVETAPAQQLEFQSLAVAKEVADDENDDGIEQT